MLLWHLGSVEPGRQSRGGRGGQASTTTVSQTEAGCPAPATHSAPVTRLHSLSSVILVTSWARGPHIRCLVILHSSSTRVSTAGPHTSSSSTPHSVTCISFSLITVSMLQLVLFTRAHSVSVRSRASSKYITTLTSSH